MELKTFRTKFYTPARCYGLGTQATGGIRQYILTD